jgi:hypothetical protein
MNKENMLKAIAVMRRAAEHKSINMQAWQSPKTGRVLVKTEEELHSCGNKACFAGYLAVSPEWIADGVALTPAGCPIITPKIFGYTAIAEWLDIPLKDEENLVHGDCINGMSCYYRKNWAGVTATDVIEKLKELMIEYDRGVKC